MSSKLYTLFNELKWNSGSWKFGKTLEWAFTVDSRVPLNWAIGIDVGTASLGVALTFDRTAFYGSMAFIVTAMLSLDCRRF